MTDGSGGGRGDDDATRRGGADDERTGTEEADDVLTVDADAVAGVVDLFGALTPAELRKALSELAFKRGVDAPPDSLVDDAVASYHLVEHDGLLVVGPRAFPALPEGAADLPHILDVDREAPPREAVATTAERRFRAEAARTLAESEAGGADGAEATDASGTDSGDPDSDAAALDRLVDVSYDLEAWGPVEVGDLRRRLDDARDGAVDE